MLTPLKSRPILLDMTTCAGAPDLSSPTHVAGAGPGGMTSLDYGVCELDPGADWRCTTGTAHRPSYDATGAAAAAAAMDRLGDRAKWTAAGAEDLADVEFDSRLCWAAYHHHSPACSAAGDAAGDARTAVASPTTSSFRPSHRTTTTTVARTHVYELPQFQS